MKKLLIAMTAAAVGFGAWATEGAGGEGTEPTTPATPTMLNESFGANWTLQAPWSYWSGAETATPAAGELTAGDALSLNTGSKVLRGNFMSDGSAKDIDTGLYFNATVTFKDPSDTLPELKESDKFALVVLDNVESIDAKKATAPATNLMVIAKYGDGAQRAYELNVAVDSDWLDDEHEIVVKAYDNVMKSGSTPCAGFLVMVDETVCKVVNSYAIVDGVVDFGVFCAGNNFEDDGLGGAGQLGYLGYVKDAIDASVQQRYRDAELLLSNVPGSATLTSVDFQGQGDIDNVSLATTGADFGADATVLTFAGYDAVKIASITVGGKAAVNGVYTITGSETADEEGKVAIVVTVNQGYVLKGEGWTKNGLTYTYAGYTLPTASAAITLKVFEPAAVVDGEDVPADEFASILEALGKTGTSTYEITLNDDVETTIDIGKGQTLVLDLNGKTVADIYNRGTLTIQDSSVAKDGTVLADLTYSCSVFNDGGVLTILGGCFEGAIENEEGTVSISGGKFKDTTGLADALADGLAFSEKDTTNDYYSVVPASNYPESDEKVVYDENLSADEKEKQKAAVELTFDAIADASDITDDDTAVTTYINTVYGNSVPADALIGANNVDISVKFSLPLMKEDPVVKIVAEAAVAGEAAAFTFQIKEGDAGNAVAIKAALAKVYEMIRYSTDLNGLDAGVVNANNGNVECTISADMKSVKVSFKSGEGKPSKGFMKVKLR